MNADTLQPQVQVISLPSEPQLQPELALLCREIAQNCPGHVILDLGLVEVISSPSLGKLLTLQTVVRKNGYKLILCNTRLATRGIFRMAGLHVVFEYSNSRRDALEALYRQGNPIVGALHDTGQQPPG